MAANQRGKKRIHIFVQVIFINEKYFLVSSAKMQVEKYFSGIVSPKKRCAVCAATEQNIQPARDSIPLTGWLNDPPAVVDNDRRLQFMPKTASAEERLIEIYKRM